MRVVRNNKDLEQHFDSAKYEALNAFGDNTMLSEKYIENPKHIEFLYTSNL
ncbi:carbamoyl-phosphate synthase L subunit-like protein [Winogradskyella arenosi]|uniref:Carbamoyl-phosphate synthase L subunit-like protein n=1 Tax=Winogradskyella arenosi TaxID=533325 RepID=A0A368ZEA2_9FLAO|nr:carbamoyl-phosphate synthase L subunit-like protein [Winogradskyella arenosi]